MKVITEQHRAH